MRLRLIHLLPWLLLSAVCTGAQTLVNDSGHPAGGVHIEFSQPVTIEEADPLFPHYHPPEASRDVWFFGWKLLPGREITIDWHPAHAKVTGVHWLAWESSRPLAEPGTIDGFEDGDLVCPLGAQWVAHSCGNGATVGPLHVGDTHGDAFLEVAAEGTGTVSITLDLPPIDVSAYAGLHLRMSADRLCSVTVELMARDPACQTGYRFANSSLRAEAGREPARFEFPFACFAVEPGACPADEAGLLTGRLIHIGIFVAAQDGTTLRVYEIGFHSQEGG